MSDEYYDEDGFRLEFEDDTSDQEKQFFMRAFPNVNKISERKVHCTSCYMHLGTAPITEAIIRMHPVLRVSHCRNCHTFYNSGEFDKGEDGSELYCRWCGQGGEVYCCSKCPYVFCKKCIVQNLSRACVQDISRNDNWQCFSCAPKIMWHLRAQHWALVNYIEKQKKDMKDKNLSVQTINNLMKQDNTTCCSGKGLNKKSTTPVAAKKATKRPSDATDFSPGAAKIPDNKRVQPRPLLPMQQSPGSTPPSAKKAKTDNNEVVCTPDIMSMFMSPEEPPPLVATRTLPPVAKPPPPKPTPPPVIPTTMPGRQVVVRPAIPANQAPVTMRMPTMANSANTAPPPVYHTINGYRIDLHTAAQQGTYRLPNGKLIQVRKQAPTATPAPTAVPPTRNIAPKPTNTYFNPVSVSPAAPVRMTNGGTNMHINIALQQQQQLQEQRLQQQRQQQQQQQQQQQLLQQQRQQQLLIQQAQAGQPQPTIVAGQINPALQLPTLALLQNMVNGPHEDSPLGKSRKNFEGKLLSGVEICQHIVNKINTLTNSNSFKNIRNVRDLKELYIHVSYLLTYAIGRFKTLQEKCVDDVKKMGFTKESDFVMMGEQISNRNPGEDKSDDEDDCEIIEQNRTVISLDSEDEDDSGSKKKKDDQANKSTPCPMETEAAVAAILQEKDDANTSLEPISVDSDERVAPAENETPNKEDMATDQSTDTATEENVTRDVISVDSTETIGEKNNASKSDDDLVEIIDGDDNDAPQTEVASEKPEEVSENPGEASENLDEVSETPEDALKTTEEASEKPEEASDNLEEASENTEEASKTHEEAAAASKDGEEANGDAVEIVESNESESVQEKTDDASVDKETAADVAVSDEEKQETTVADDEELAQEKENDNVDGSAEEDVAIACEGDKQESVSEEDKNEAVSEDNKQESPEAETTVEDKTEQAQDTEMESSEVEQTLEVKAVEASKEDENENKENQSPTEVVSDAVESEETAVEDEETDKNDDGDAENSEAMEVDGQQEDKVESILSTEEETKPSETGETPASPKAIEEDPLAKSAEEQQMDEAPDTGTVSEPEPDTTDSNVESSTNDLPAEHQTVDSPQISEVDSSDNCDAAEPALDESIAEETPVENFPRNGAPPAEESPEATPVAVETPIEEILDAQPTGNDLLAQIEDSFLKLQEMIDSTEEASEEQTKDQLAEDDQAMAEDTAGIVSSEELPTEQMEVDESEAESAALISDMLTPEAEESQGPSSDEAGCSTMAEDKTEQPLMAECNGLLEENGASDSNGISDELDDMADALGDEMLEMGKMATAADVENINSPEMISGDY